jgi:uncharacterized protein YggE
MKPLLAPALGFLALTALLASPALAQSIPANLRSITVAGESSEQFSPDQAILSVSLVTRDKDLNLAKKQNDDMVTKLASIAQEYKIPKEKIATSQLYISPEYDYSDKMGRKFVGYTVNRSLRITIDTLDIHERLLSAIVDAKIDQINGIEFRLANPEAHAGELRVKAFENAKAKAAALAQAAGAKLGPVITITTVDMNTPIPGPRPMMMQAKMADASEMSIAPSLPGMVELRQSVTVVFGME